MDNPGSFIPRQAKSSNRPVQKVRRIYVFSYISYVLFFGTLLVVAALFGFEYLVNRNLEQQKAALADQRAQFSQSDLIQVRELNERMKKIDQLLDTQANLSSVFVGLEETVLSTVSYSDITIERDLPTTFTVTLTGNTDSFDSLQFQNEVLNSAQLPGSYVISDVDFSNGENSENGDSGDGLLVKFNLTQTVAVSDIPFTGADIEIIQTVEPVTEDVSTTTESNLNPN